MRVLHLAALAILLIGIVACAPEKETAPQPTQPRPDNAPVNQAVPSNSAITKETAQADPGPGAIERPNAETEKLFANIGNVKSYSFDIVYLPDAGAKHKYFIKGSKAKVELQQPILFPDKFTAHLVYLDFDAKTAFAYCQDGRPGCDPTIAKPVSYEDYEIILPPQWVDRLKYGTRTKSLTYLNVPVHVVEYESEGKYYQAYVHNYHGMPLRVAISNDKAMTDIVGGYEYRSMAFNTVKDADVLPPQ